MKKTLTILALATLAFSCSSDNDKKAPSEAATFEMTTAVLIPDAIGGCGQSADSPEALSNLAVTAEGTIGHPEKVTISLNLEHPYGGDIVIELVAPNGSACTLIKRLGDGTGDFGDGTSFHSSNTLSFNSANTEMLDWEGLDDSAQFPTGNYAPTSGLGTFPASAVMVPLDDFLHGKNVQGTWAIRMHDYCSGEAGSLVHWKIVFAEGALN